jgi:hypothetical protein
VRLVRSMDSRSLLLEMVMESDEQAPFPFLFPSQAYW